MRVAVDEARDEQAAGQAHDVPPLPRAVCADDRRDAPVHELDRAAAAHAAGLEHEVGDEQRPRHGSIGRSRPRSRAVSRASG